MINRRVIAAMGAALSLGFSMSSCGSKEKSSDAPISIPPIQSIFLGTSNNYSVPRDILLAVTYKESGLSPAPSKTSYTIDTALKGPALGETAVGLPRAVLGLADSDESNTLERQVDAYGAWIKKKLDEQHLTLSVDISKADDAYNWVWQLARLHYPDSPKNIQVLFAKELLNILNKGFIWQDPNSDERIELAPHYPQLDNNSFSPTVQANLTLDTRTSEIFDVDYLQLSYVSGLGAENRPRKIRVIHCPFSLTTCLGTQLQKTSDTPVPMQAHYVIPPDDSLLVHPVKVLQHRSPVTLLDNQGKPELVTDAVVVMLVGNSGRVVNGERTQTNPSWYTAKQLRMMGLIVQGACELIAQDNPTVDVETCRTPGTGVEFADPAKHSVYQYGDIPDFDNSIFSAFVKNPTNADNAPLDIRLPGSTKLFNAGSPISINFTFLTGTAKLEVQRLERCSSGKTIWTTVQTLFLRSVSQQSVQVTFYDQGPNKNGQHFIRGLTYGSDGALLGWSVTDLFLANFDRNDQVGPNALQCGE